MHRIVQSTGLSWTAIGVFVFLLCGPALAADITWNGGTGLWSTASNWSSSTVPGSSDNVFIDSKTSTTSVVNLDANASIFNLTIDASDTLNIQNSRSLTITGTSFNNSGTLSLSASNLATHLIVGSGGTVTLTGGGDITLSNNTGNRIYTNTAGSVLDNVDNTISGAGYIYTNAGLTLINEAAGIIDATGTAALYLQDFTGSYNLINKGILRSSNTTSGNGGLVLQNTTVDNTGNSNGGRITAIGANTHVDLNGGTILGGILTTSDGGVIQTASGSGTLNGTTAQVNITSGSTVLVNNNTSLTLLGTINNSGTIQMNSSNLAANLLLADGTQFTGGGYITLSNSTGNRIYGSTNSGTEVATNVNNTIQGAGYIGYGNLIGFINQASGVINANGTNALIITPTTNSDVVSANGGGFVNRGLLEATNTGGLYLSGGVFNNNGGLIQAVGSGNNVYLTNGTTIAGGTLQGSDDGNAGLIETPGGQSATLDGSSQGALTITGTYQVSNNSTTSLLGAINNTGTIQMNASNLAANLLLADGNQFTGGGYITLSNSTGNRIYGSTNSGTEVATNVNNTIQGAGYIGYGNLIGFINQASGVINANGTNALIITPTTNSDVVSANGGGFVNRGLLEATNTGGLYLSGGVFNNNGGLIQAVGSGNNVYLTNGTTIAGGTLQGSDDGNAGLIETPGGQSATLDGSSQRALTITGTYQVSNDSTTSLLGAINNTGTIQMNSSNLAANLIVGSGGTVTLTGGGDITLSNSTGNRIYTNTAGSVLDNVDNTISGAGYIYTNAGLTLINEAAGIIDATGTAALYLQNFTGSYNIINKGILRSSNTTSGNGGLVLLNTTVDNTGNTNGGRITASGVNTHVDLNGGTILGGILTTSDGGVIQTASGGGTLNGTTAQVNITSGSTVLVNNNTSLTLLGAINNIGTIQMNSTNLPAYLLLADGTQFTGGGYITLSNSTSNRIYGSTDSGTEKVTNVNNTIQGAGYIGYGNSIVFINQTDGIINANSTVALTITPTTNSDVVSANGGGFVNRGLLEATNTGGLYLSGGVFNNNGGLIQAVGSGNNVYLTNGTTIAGGTLQGSDDGNAGLIETPGGQSATLDGSSQGALTITGTYQVSNNSTTSLLGAINNTGTIQMNASNLAANLIVGSGGTVTLTGGGDITLSNSTGNRIYTNTAGSVLDNVDNTISGAGYIYTNTGLTLINEAAGIIDATGTAALYLQNFTASYNLINDGILRSSNTTSGNGGLVLQNTTVDNTGNSNGGRITAIGANTHVDLNGGTILGGILTTSDGGVIQTASGGGTLNGTTAQVNITSGSTVLVNNSTSLTLLGAINNIGTIQMNATNMATNLLLADGTQFTGGGYITLSNSTGNRIYGSTNSGTEVATNVNNTIQGAGYIGYGNSIGIINSGTINATGTAALVLAPSTAITTGLVNQAGGVLRGSGTGGLSITQGTITNLGTVEALANSKVVIGSTATVTNLSGGILTGGIWKANSLGGTGATIDFQGANTFISRNDADIYLIGAGSVIQGRNGTLTQSLDSSLWDNRGSLHIQDRTFIAAGNAGNFYNRAGSLLELNNATFQSASLTMNANNLADISTINSYGTSTLTLTTSASQVGNNGIGQIHALSGTLTISNGVNLGSNASLSSSMTNYAGATINLSSATAASKVGTLNNNGSLNLGSQNINVSSDYTNANFGVGNDFDTHANVSGTGQILATGDVGISLTGAGITGGTTDTPTLTLGNVHVGAANNGSFAINNTGTTGPVIRGAIQTGTTSGLGITDQNFGPIALGGSTTVNYSYTAASGGALSGQTFNVVTNFDNVTGKSVALNATAYYLAQGSATPTPVTIANQRVGGTRSQLLTVANTAPSGTYTEGLNAAFGANTGDATNNGGTISLLAGGAGNASAMSVGVNTASAGAKSGTAALNYVSDGTGTSGLGTTGVGSQTITVSGNVYQIAQPTLASSTIVLANRHVGDAASQPLSITNTSAAPDGYQEALNASFSGTSGNATAAGTVGLLAQGAGDNTSLVVGIDTSSAGAKSGTATLALQTDGAGTSGLGSLDLTSQTVTVSGSVYRLATAQIDNAAAFSFGNVHVGDTVQKALSITNTDGADGFSEGLNASFGGASDSRITTSGSLALLGAGATDTSSLLIGVNTSAAGSVNGTATVLFASDGTGTSGLGITDLPSQDVSVTATIEGGVYRLANPLINTAQPIDYGNVRINTDVTPTALSITNNVPDDGYSEKLNAAAGTTTGGINASGSFTLLGAGQTDTTSIIVGLDTSVAGNRSGVATITFVSDGTGTSGLGQTPLTSQTVQVNGTVYRLANPTVNTPSITLVARVGDTSPTAPVSLTNTSPDIYTEGLKAGIGTSSSSFTTGGSISNLAAQQTNSSTLWIGLGTGTAGSFTGVATLALATTGVGTTGASDLGLSDQNVTLNGKVYTAAVSQVKDTTIDFGIVHKGDSVSAQALTVTNGATQTALNDVLTGSFSGTTGAFSASGNLGSGLAAGESDSSSLTAALDTTNAGIFSSNATASFLSSNPDMTDLDLGEVNISLKAQVNNYANPVFHLASGDGTLNYSDTGVYNLIFGDVVQNSDIDTAVLNLINDITGPSDLLNGTFEFLDDSDFTLTGFVSFSDIAAGESADDMSIAFDTSNLGLFTDSILLHAIGYNASGYYGSLPDIVLNISCNVVEQQAPVPVPATLLLFGSSLLGLLGMKRAFRK